MCNKAKYLLFLITTFLFFSTAVTAQVKIAAIQIEGNKKTETVIDAEDYEKCRLIIWSSHTDRQGNIRIYSAKIGPLHTFILNHIPTRKIVGDHINENTLDNRKRNLYPEL
jgi:hypothetical protein